MGTEEVSGANNPLIVLNNPLIAKNMNTRKFLVDPFNDLNHENGVASLEPSGEDMISNGAKNVYNNNNSAPISRIFFIFCENLNPIL